MSKVLVLRCCKPDLTSYNGFQWPRSGPVSCPDWDRKPQCGNGLHGWLWGYGDLTASDIWDDPYSVWLVVSVDESSLVDLGGKVKFPEGCVVFCGPRADAASYVVQNGGAGKPVMFVTATAGHRGTATAGDYGTAAAGDYGTAAAGDYGTATAGDGGTATAGYGGTAAAGYGGTAAAGHRGTATAGGFGTAAAGGYGTAAAGDGGTAAVGVGGKAKAGKSGVILIRREVDWELRTRCAFVGECGVRPDVFYRLDEAGNVVEAEDQTGVENSEDS